MVARPFNHIGPRQAAEFATADFAKQIARIEAGLQSPVIRVGNLSVYRDTTDVRDVVAAYAQLLSYGQSGRTYNVCAGHAVKIEDLLETLRTLSSAKTTVESASDRFRPNDVPVIVGDRSRIQEEVGWTPKISVQQTLSDLLDYWRHKVSLGG